MFNLFLVRLGFQILHHPLNLLRLVIVVLELWCPELDPLHQIASDQDRIEQNSDSPSSGLCASVNASENSIHIKYLLNHVSVSSQDKVKQPLGALRSPPAGCGGLNLGPRSEIPGCADCGAVMGGAGPHVHDWRSERIEPCGIR